MRIEAIFGGIAGVIVLVAIFYALASTQFGGSSNTGGGHVSTNSGGSGGTITSGIDTTGNVCECYDEAFKLAGSDVGVMSAQYRTGFEQCRAIRGIEGGEAWTAGWNARLSAKPYEASCRSYKNRK